MTKAIAALLATAFLSACGADGAPVRPNVDLAIGLTPNGVTVRPTASVSAGPVRVSAGL